MFHVTVGRTVLRFGEGRVIPCNTGHVITSVCLVTVIKGDCSHIGKDMRSTECPSSLQCTLKVSTLNTYAPFELHMLPVIRGIDNVKFNVVPMFK